MQLLFIDLLITFRMVAFLGNLFSFLWNPSCVLITLMASSASLLSRIVKFVLNPIRPAYFLRIVFANEWNVPPATFEHLSSRILDALLSISLAARLVKVSNSIDSGFIPDSTSFATLYTKVLVLPVPAPAITNTGPSVIATALYWASFSSSS